MSTAPATGISLRPRLHFSNATPEVVEVLRSIPRSRMNATLEALVVKAIVHGLQFKAGETSNNLVSDQGSESKATQVDTPPKRHRSSTSVRPSTKVTQPSGVKRMLGGQPLSAAISY